MYAKINTKSIIADELRAFILNATKEWWLEYYGFKTLVVPNAIVHKDSVMSTVYSLHPFTAGILKLDPHEVYDWHVDGRRGVTINMLLEGFDSQCLFRDEDTKEEFKLPYEPDTYFLFDTQKTHKVSNGADTRYVFSLEFFEALDKLNYDKLHKELEKLCC